MPLFKLKGGFYLPRNDYYFKSSNSLGYQEQSLPNITGSVYSRNDCGFRDDNYTGVFHIDTDSYSIPRVVQRTSDYTGSPLTFDASRSNSIYQDNSNVNVRSVNCLVYFFCY